MTGESIAKSTAEIPKIFIQEGGKLGGKALDTVKGLGDDAEGILTGPLVLALGAGALFLVMMNKDKLKF